MKEKKDKAVHVEFHDANLQKSEINPEGKHFYFGSVAAIFDKKANVYFDPKKLGVCRQRLYRHGLTPENPFENKKCVIRTGALTRKPTERKPPVNVIHVTHGKM